MQGFHGDVAGGTSFSKICMILIVLYRNFRAEISDICQDGTQEGVMRVEDLESDESAESNVESVLIKSKILLVSLSGSTPLRAAQTWSTRSWRPLNFSWN